jgi:hypothetical protein
MRQTKVFFTVVCLLLFLRSSYGQASPAKVGYIRFWDMLPPTSGTFEVRKTSGATSEPTMLIGTAYKASGYGEYSVGKYHLGVFKRGEDRPVKIFDVDLKPETYLTILISPQSIDLFDDTIDPKATTGTITVRNYFIGATVAVVSRDQRIVDALPYGNSYMAAGLPLSSMPITVHAHLPNEQTAEAGGEVNFKTSKRATVLIIPDSYGRFRSRITEDGKN